jgi:hypothetical protein
MAQFGNLIKSLATKAGIKTEDETLKKILGFPDVAQLEVPDEFNTALEGNLLTVDSAMAHTDVRRKLIAEAMNGADTELDRQMEDLGFDDAFKAEWKLITKNTNEKIRKLSKAVKDREAKIKADAEAGKHKDPNAEAQLNALKGQITELNKTLDQSKTQYQVELENLKAQNLQDKKDFHLTNFLAGKPLPKNGIPQEVNILTAKTLIQSEAAKHGLVVNFDANGQPTLKQRKDGAEIDFFIDNKPVNYSSFIDGVLAQHKFLQVNDPQPGNGQGNNQQQPTPPPGAKNNQAVVSSIDAQLAMLTGQV